MNICFPFAGGIVGGSHVSAMKLIRALDRRQFTPLVLLHRCEGPLVDLLLREGIAFEAAPTADFVAPGGGRSLRKLVTGARITATLGRFLRQRAIDIVHTNDGPMHATWALAARLAGAKLLWHHRGNPGAAGLRYLAPWLANRVVAVSDFAAPQPGKWSAASKCSVVRSPFELNAVQPDAAAVGFDDPALPDGARVLGFFGLLTARKRPLVFVDAVAAVIARDPALNVVGLIFGDAYDPGLREAVVERAAALGIADRIRMMGFRTPPEPWLVRCDLLVVTAVEEPFGRTLIEAMMLGTPVVAAASGGNVEAIRDGETGVLVEPDAPEAFADAIVRLLRDPAAAQAIATTAQREALQSYGVDGHVRAISSIYREMVAA